MAHTLQVHVSQCARNVKANLQQLLHVNLLTARMAVKATLQLLCQCATITKLHSNPHLKTGMTQGGRQYGQPATVSS